MFHDYWETLTEENILCHLSPNFVELIRDFTSYHANGRWTHTASRSLYLSAQPVVTKCHWLEGWHNGRMFVALPGAGRGKVKLAGWISSTPSPVCGCLGAHSRALCSVCVCLPSVSSSSERTPVPWHQGPRLLSSFNLNYHFEDPVSKQWHTLR